MADPKQAALERKLLKMTRANGCTEAEAMVAAEKAARLMAELKLALGDLEFEGARAKVPAGWHSVRAPLWTIIATCTNTSVIMHGAEVEYIGRAPWPEVAQYLHKVTGRAIDAALREFQSDRWYRRRSSVRAKRAASFDFTKAMVNRLAEKIWRLFEASISVHAMNSALAERDRRYPDQVQVPKRDPARPNLPRYDRAALQGGVAGDGVQISHGVGSEEAPVKIGGRP